MYIRRPVVAGRFYPADPQECRAEVDRLFGDRAVADKGGRGKLIGGIVPHAGWVFSGDVAAQVFGTLSRQASPTTVVLFGAVHRFGDPQAALIGAGAWATPIGDVAIDDELASAVLTAADSVVDAPAAHEQEHAIEVQVPFVKVAWPDAKILPVAVPPTPAAHDVGKAVAHAAQSTRTDVLFVGSTDLTHYGPDYGFAPRGTGADAIQWAKEENDRAMIDLITSMRADAVVAEAEASRNACGSGAIAATVAACSVLGAGVGTVLAHTTSAEVQTRLGMGRAANSVGYVGAVFS